MSSRFQALSKITGVSTYESRFTLPYGRKQCVPSVEKECHDRKIEADYGDLPVCSVDITYVSAKGIKKVCTRFIYNGSLNKEDIVEMAKFIEHSEQVPLRTEGFDIANDEYLL